MILHTASEGITLAKKLENDSAKFYEDLAHRYTKDAETFLSFARDNKKNIAQIERTYYGVITDAIEGSYAFNIDPDDYTFKITIPDGANYADILDQAVKIEEKIIKFYSDAAEQSESLMADVPRVFKMVARKRNDRGTKLRALKVQS
jgi:rubrerythrin